MALLEQALTDKSYIVQEMEKQKELGIENLTVNAKDNDLMVKEGKEMVSKVLQSYLGHALPFAPTECIM